MRKSIIWKAIIILFIIYIIPSVSAESCIEDISIYTKSYEKYGNIDGYFSYRESPHQIISQDGFFREGDSLFIEGISAKINSSCNSNEEIFYIKFKRPNGETWGEQIGIDLKFGNPPNENYAIQIKEKGKPGNYVDSLGNSFGFTSIKNLDSVGRWEFGAFYSNHEEIENADFINKISNEDIRLFFPKDEVWVNDRVAVTSLQATRNSLEISKITLWIAVISLIISIFLGLVVPLFRDRQRQISLLESLYSELDAISSKMKKIKLLNKEITTEGNLQWVKELFEFDLKPGHGIWKLDTQIYVGGLNKRVKFIKTESLKNVLIHISQKIELIENYLIQYNQVPEKNKEPIKKAIMKILNEVIELVEETKEYIKKEFALK